MLISKRAFQQRKLQCATRAFTKATRLQPEKMEAWVNLRSVLLEAGEYPHSLDALRHGIALAPAVMKSYMLPGDVLRLLGLINESLAAYRRLEPAIELMNSQDDLAPVSGEFPLQAAAGNSNKPRQCFFHR